MFELALLGLRIGTRPQAVITTTPKPITILRRLLAEPTTRLSRETTFANKLHLAPEFVDQITAMYAGSRLGLQELDGGDRRDVGGDPVPHVRPELSGPAHHTPGGVHLGAAGQAGHRLRAFPARRGPLVPSPGARRATAGSFRVFADYYAWTRRRSECPGDPGALVGGRATAGSMGSTWTRRRARKRRRPGGAGGVRPGRSGERITTTWPTHRVLEGLDQVEILLGGPDRDPDLMIHPRCTFLIESFRTYRRAERRGRGPRPARGSPASGRGGDGQPPGAVRVVYPEGRAPSPQLRAVPARSV